MIPMLAESYTDFFGDLNDIGITHPEVYYSLISVLNYFCSFLCFTYSMHRYINWLLNCHYQPLLSAKHLKKNDMMSSLSSAPSVPNIQYLSLKKVPESDKNWVYSHWNFNFFATQGERKTMEDRMGYLHDSLKNRTMFTVFDGHGGAYVSEFLERKFNNTVVAAIAEEEERLDVEQLDCLSTGQVIKEITTKLDEELMKKKMKTVNYTGSTLLSAYIHQNRFLTIINVGDSRAVGCDIDGNCVVLSTDHKADNPEERERVERAGGFVEFYGVQRVQGVLAVSRAFGDSALKRGGYITAQPDIRTIDLAARPLRYVILATDGFWDVCSNIDAVNEVNYQLAKQQKEQEPNSLFCDSTVGAAATVGGDSVVSSGSTVETTVPLGSTVENTVASNTKGVSDTTKTSNSTVSTGSRVPFGSTVPTTVQSRTESESDTEDWSNISDSDELLEAEDSEEETEENPSVTSTKDTVTAKDKVTANSKEKDIAKVEDDSDTSTDTVNIGKDKVIVNIQVNNKARKASVVTLLSDLQDVQPQNTLEVPVAARRPSSCFGDFNVAEHLVRLAVSRRTSDNVSVFVIRLDKF